MSRKETKMSLNAFSSMKKESKDFGESGSCFEKVSSKKHKESVHFISKSKVSYESEDKMRSDSFFGDFDIEFFTPATLEQVKKEQKSYTPKILVIKPNETEIKKKKKPIVKTYIKPELQEPSDKLVCPDVKFADMFDKNSIHVLEPFIKPPEVITNNDGIKLNISFGKTKTLTENDKSKTEVKENKPRSNKTLNTIIESQLEFLENPDVDRTTKVTDRTVKTIIPGLKFSDMFDKTNLEVVEPLVKSPEILTNNDGAKINISFGDSKSKSPKDNNDEKQRKKNTLNSMIDSCLNSIDKQIESSDSKTVTYEKTTKFVTPTTKFSDMFEKTNDEVLEPSVKSQELPTNNEGIKINISFGKFKPLVTVENSTSEFKLPTPKTLGSFIESKLVSLDIGKDEKNIEVQKQVKNHNIVFDHHFNSNKKESILYCLLYFGVSIRYFETNENYVHKEKNNVSGSFYLEYGDRLMYLDFENCRKVDQIILLPLKSKGNVIIDSNCFYYPENIKFVVNNYLNIKVKEIDPFRSYFECVPF